MITASDPPNQLHSLSFIIFTEVGGDGGCVESAVAAATGARGGGRARGDESMRCWCGERLTVYYGKFGGRRCRVVTVRRYQRRLPLYSGSVAGAHSASH